MKILPSAFLVLLIGASVKTWLADIILFLPRKKNVTLYDSAIITDTMHSFQILTLITRGERLQKPVMCPDWLYELSVRCRDPEADRRPTAAQVVQSLEKEYKATVLPDRTFL
jgi:hypothetical protein